jgi:hypothetical protein
MQKILTLMFLLALSATAAATPAAVLVYQVWEEGADPYVSRVMVTEDYVRLDEGSDVGGYTLFDRQQEILYNVQIEDRSILVMNSDAPIPESSPGLILQQEVEVDEEAPRVAGAQPTQVRLLANGELCSEMVVVEGVMEDALEGLRELKLSLARIQSSTLDATPLSMRTPCDLAANLYAADRPLNFGLPLQERSAGRSQSLVDFSPDYEADDALFQLPADFSRRSMPAPGAI